MRKQKEKRPLIDRFKKSKILLENSLWNTNRKYEATTNIEPLKQEHNVVDLFSGAGGIALGFKMAGYKPVFGVEIDEDASSTYQRNFPEANHYTGPIQNISNDDIPKFLNGNEVHVLTAGFPCQGFSVAGLRDPKDERNQLYKEALRFTKEIKPWFVVLENVPGLISMEKGTVHGKIINDFSKIGYPNMSVLILESAAYGVPQIRPRTVFVANRFGLKNPYPKPILAPQQYVSIESAIDDMKNHPRDPSINHEWTWHSQEMIDRISKVTPGHSLYESYVDAWKRQYPGLPSMTIKENHGGTHIHYELNRVLSAREMARLQTFPDDFIFSGTMKRAMWQIGNAVPPLLFKHIALALAPSLKEIEKLNITQETAVIKQTAKS